MLIFEAYRLFYLFRKEREGFFHFSPTKPPKVFVKRKRCGNVFHYYYMAYEKCVVMNISNL